MSVDTLSIAAADKSPQNPAPAPLPPESVCSSASAAGSAAAARPHYRYLDGLRALAALYVVLYHASLQNREPYASPWATELARLLGFGHWAVDVFIVLSGFCLMLPVVQGRGGRTDRAGVLQFLRKRARRILPPYYAAVLLSLALIATCIGRKTGTHWDIALPVTLRDVVTHLFLLQDAFPGSALKINHVLWSISVEWRIYLVFPLLLICWRRFGGLIATGAAFLCSLLLLAALGQTHVNLAPWGVSPHYLTLFALGALAADAAFSPKGAPLRWRNSLPWRGIGIAALCAPPLLMAFLWNFSGSRFAPSMMAQDFLIGGATALLLVPIRPGGELPGLTRLLGGKPLAFVGTFAYSLYLFHAPLLQILSQYVLMPLRLTADESLLLLVLLGLPLIVAASFAFFCLFERPFLSSHSRKPATLAGTAAAAAAPAASVSEKFVFSLGDTRAAETAPAAGGMASAESAAKRRDVEQVTLPSL